MTAAGRLVTLAVKKLIDSRCRIDDSELSRIPYKGPFIIIMNHTNFLEVPLMYTHLLPRPVVGLAKAESWNVPFHGYLARQWGGIPIRRGAVDMNAFRLISDSFNNSKILIMAPEGTRNVTGVLKRAHPGIVMLALKNKVPVVPVAHFGGENIWSNLKRFRKTDFTIKVGRPFYIDTRGLSLTSDLRKSLLRSVMVQLARLLPEEYRGEYADFGDDDDKYLRFLEEGTYSSDDPEPLWIK